MAERLFVYASSSVIGFGLSATSKSNSSVSGELAPGFSTIQEAKPALLRMLLQAGNELLARRMVVIQRIHDATALTAGCSGASSCRASASSAASTGGRPRVWSCPWSGRKQCVVGGAARRLEVQDAHFAEASERLLDELALRPQVPQFNHCHSP